MSYQPNWEAHSKHLPTSQIDFLAQRLEEKHQELSTQIERNTKRLDRIEQMGWRVLAAAAALVMLSMQDGNAAKHFFIKLIGM